uniref:NifN n=1 Tax=Frankia sp. (strain EuIK1) TaxID=47227 RepID=Q9Z5Y4_FRASE|nr:NifN [Frankia sp. EuIK1]
MARVVTSDTRPGLDPLRFSLALGGRLVFLRLAQRDAVMHGSQGCASLAKALLTRHFNEPVPLQTTCHRGVAVLGSGDDRGRRRPGPPVHRDDEPHQPEGAPLIVRVSTPPFAGGLSDGWSAACARWSATVPFDHADSDEYPVRLQDRLGSGPRRSPCSSARLSAADLDELCALIRSFGMAPVLVPDLSGSSTAPGPVLAPTTTVAPGSRSCALDEAGLIITARRPPRRPGSTWPRAPPPTSSSTTTSRLAAMDRLVTELIDGLLGRAAPEVRPPARLAHGLLDTHFVLGGARVALAMEPEALVAVGSLLHDVGGGDRRPVSPTDAPVLATAPWDEIVDRHLTELEDLPELLIGSSHVRGATASRRHCRSGSDLRRAPAALRTTGGYGAGLRLLVDAANRLLDHQHHHSDHRPDLPSGSRAGHEDAAQPPLAPFDQLDVLCQESPC